MVSCGISSVGVQSILPSPGWGGGLYKQRTPSMGGGMELASERSSSMAGSRRLLTGIGDLG